MRFFNASIAALALLSLLVVVPKIFEIMLEMPAKPTTTRTGPPATRPRPSPAGFKITLALENFPMTSWGMVPFFIVTVIEFFFAARVACYVG